MVFQFIYKDRRRFNYNFFKEKIGEIIDLSIYSIKKLPWNK